MTPSVPPGVGNAAAPPQAGRTVPTQHWVENVETGQTRTVTAEELEQLQSPWRQITAAEAARHHMRSVW